jgi:hypothetical protein
MDITKDLSDVDDDHQAEDEIVAQDTKDVLAVTVDRAEHEVVTQDTQGVPATKHYTVDKIVAQGAQDIPHGTDNQAKGCQTNSCWTGKNTHEPILRFTLSAYCVQIVKPRTGDEALECPQNQHRLPCGNTQLSKNGNLFKRKVGL